MFIGSTVTSAACTGALVPRLMRLQTGDVLVLQILIVILYVLMVLRLRRNDVSTLFVFVSNEPNNIPTVGTAGIQTVEKVRVLVFLTVHCLF